MPPGHYNIMISGIHNIFIDHGVMWLTAVAYYEPREWQFWAGCAVFLNLAYGKVIIWMILKNYWCHVIVKWIEEGNSREYRISASCLDTIFSFALSQLISPFEVASVLAVIITSPFPWFMEINRFMWMAQIIKCATYCIWSYFGVRQFILIPRKSKKVTHLKTSAKMDIYKYTYNIVWQGYI